LNLLNVLKVINEPSKFDDQLNKTVEENYKKLIPMIKTIIFCGRYNIPLRGHRDDVNL